MDDERKTVISKTLSRILRHNPSSALSIDMAGNADLALLLAYLRSIRPFSETGISAGEIEETVTNDPKGRFHIDNGRIRALSGHSFPVITDGSPFYPSGPLYFGTTEASRNLLSDGLTLSKKLKVRLSHTFEAALAVADLRPGNEPLVIEVDAERLAEDGWDFEALSNGEVLTDPIGADYLSEAHRPTRSPAHRHP